MNEPFPNQLLLSRKEAAQVLGVSETAWRRLFTTDAGKRFPAARMLGKTAKGKPMLRWLKWEVVAFILILERAPTNRD
jgi:predicted DNA-binding transcriptional regulator AlpA